MPLIKLSPCRLGHRHNVNKIGESSNILIPSLQKKQEAQLPLNKYSKLQINILNIMNCEAQLVP